MSIQILLRRRKIRNAMHLQLSFPHLLVCLLTIASFPPNIVCDSTDETVREKGFWEKRNFVMGFTRININAHSRSYNSGFVKAVSENCEAFGYRSIQDKDTCVEAAKALLPDGYDAFTVNRFRDVTNGCTTYVRLGLNNLVFQKDICDTEVYQQYCNTCDEFFPCLCQVPETTAADLPQKKEEFIVLSEGNCSEYDGYATIQNKQECMNAADFLFPQHGSMESDYFSDVIDGCTIDEKGGIIFNPPNQCNKEKYKNYCTQCDSIFKCMCVKETYDYKLITSGDCGTHGFEAIQNVQECVESAKSLKINIESGPYVVDVTDQRSGCTTHVNSLVINQGLCNADSYPRACMTCDETFSCLCKKPVSKILSGESTYKVITSGTCDRIMGYRPIDNKTDCIEAAAAAMKTEDFRPLISQPAVTDGCTFYVDGDWKSAVYNQPGTCDNNLYQAFCDRCDISFPCICVRDSRRLRSDVHTP
mmetsp:Transcript_40499/g.95123  ORF Transcript_40499/g.95123 Transcript_40499/m.95123 type:complete len:475 (-) Transcript_40499:159-1583(-)